MKKLLFVLLIVALASFLFVGCTPTVPAEGEGEGEGEVEGVTVAIADSAKVGDYTYVSAGSHDITVTFPTPVAGLVSASISPCSGDYTKAFIAGGSSVVLFPDATRKIWTGSGTFTASASDCCASYVEVVSGECTDTVCIAFPVIVDGGRPYALIEVDVANCECDGCAINFSSTSTDPDCAESELCCGDDCSGLASWSINLYDAYPFDVCCDPTVCEEPIGTGSGIDCPIDFTTVCLTAGTYWAVISLVDNVGLEQNYYAKIVVSGGTANTSDCSIVVTEGFEAPAPYCITWATNPTATIGACIPMGPQPGDDKVTLTMAVNPSGGGTTSPAVGAHPGYAENQVVNINATPASGYHFVNWTGAVADLNSASTTVTMNANKTVTANFELDAETYALTMAVNPSGGGTTSPAVGAHPGYAENQVVNITATPATGYHFVNWTGAVTGSVNPTTVTMDANKTVTANFDLTDVNDGPDVVDLGSAGLVGSDFLILAKTAITATGATSITGDVGISPNKAGSITGFGLTMDSTNVFSTSSLMTGKVYAADYYPPTPANMTTAISAMEAAYTDAAGRTNPTATELGDGNIGGMTLAPGLYKWSTDVIIPTDVTLSGDANDVWIFQIARDLSIASKGDVASGIKVLLTGGAQASNVFWQVGGPTGATLGTYSTFNGTILSAKQIIIETGAVLNGRAWAQSEVTLDSNTIVHP